MTNNDILRRVRYIFDIDDSGMITIFKSAGYDVSRSQVSDWLKKEDDSDFIKMTDFQFAAFLNGLINEKRGKRDGEQSKPEKRLNNNLIFKKLKIALKMRDEDIIDVFKFAKFRISKHELSAFFRRPDHLNYRECKDQFLRAFLKGLQIKFRDAAD